MKKRGESKTRAGENDIKIIFNQAERFRNNAEFAEFLFQANHET